MHRIVSSGPSLRSSMVLVALLSCSCSTTSGSGPDAGSRAPTGSSGGSDASSDDAPAAESASSGGADGSPGGGSSSGGGADASASSADASSESGAGGASDGGAGDARSPGDSGVISPSGGTCGTTWKNPTTQYAHDPSVIKSGSTYYVYYTGRTVPFATSTDKVNWSDGGIAQPALPAWASTLGLTGPPDIWAPDVHEVGGKFYAYYSVSSWGDVTHSAIGLMTNTTLDPSAPGYAWLDHGKVIGSPEGGGGVNVIDPDLFVDDDGTWWLVYGSFHAGIRAIKLDPATGMSLTSPPNPIALTTSLGEGSSLIKANGYYYLVVSRGLCCSALRSTYEVVYGRSTKVTGPYVNRNGQSMNSTPETLLAAGQDGNPGQGGQSFFEESGQFYIDYHAYQPPNGTATLNVRPVYFDTAGWMTLDVCMAKGYAP